MKLQKMEEISKFMESMVDVANRHGMIIVVDSGMLKLREIPEDTFIDIEWEGDHLVWTTEYLGDVHEI